MCLPDSASVHLQGNIALNVRASFEYKLLQVINPLDLLITEIMADPSPTVGLPLYEYVELLNTSDHAINLADLTLRFDQTDYVIGTAAILVSPGEYVILCESTAVALLMPYGKVIALPRWPAIRNTNGLLSLWFAGKEIFTSCPMMIVGIRTVRKPMAAGPSR
ncbi:MAG: lamin tail domain-containing protein [Saprospiraceae bacterium]|nr:lamin tail domain-containing protein [Saprospiraceae bacterium]